MLVMMLDSSQAEADCCDICFDTLEPQSTLITPCVHVYCQPCITMYVEERGQAEAGDGDLKKGEAPCPSKSISFPSLLMVWWLTWSSARSRLRQNAAVL